MNTRSVFFVVSLLAVIAAVSASKRGGLLGAYRPIKDLKSPEVQEIAKYAVTEHNKIAGASLEYVKTSKGEEQVVAGTNYRLVISAKDGKTVGNYQVVVYDRPWDHYRNLTSFTAV